MRRAATCIALALLAWTALAAAEERAIEIEMTLDASQEAIWRAWTTAEGVRSFFAPGCNIEPRVDGAYEIFFDPEAEPGHRGADGMRILVLEPMHRFAFTWNAPASLPHVRQQRTRVTVHLEPLGENRTRLRLRHDGWGEGGEWDRALQYFTRAWNEAVLPRLQYALSHGPVDWKNPPSTHADP